MWLLQKGLSIHLIIMKTELQEAMREVRGVAISKAHVISCEVVAYERDIHIEDHCYLHSSMENEILGFYYYIGLSR